MENKKTPVFENCLIWFGAAVSLAEIITGTYFAPLGFKKGLAAIIIGHIIGCILLFLAGVIGGKTEKSAMETVKMSFGKKGSFVFALLNVIQLIGWTGIMIYDGAIAANGIFNIGRFLWSELIGFLVIFWILFGIKNLGKINTISMITLLLLTVVLCIVIFKNNGVKEVFNKTITFGSAVELSVAMPLSWLPLISDYTKNAKKAVKATAASALTYTIASCWMYFIGMSAAMLAGSSDIANIMTKAGLGIAGLIIIVLSTVTTTFLDAYSAGVSSETLFSKISPKVSAVFSAVVGTLGAMLFSMENITGFLYFIGSVFSPMVAIQITDFFIIKKDYSTKDFDICNLCIWFFGFALYRILMTTNFVLGSTVADMAVTVLICLAVNKVRSIFHKAQ